MTQFDRTRFAGRRALVTGASRGIGAGIAERLAAEGADVAIVARTLDFHPTLPGSLRATADVLATHGGRVATIVADLSDSEDRPASSPRRSTGSGGASTSSSTTPPPPFISRWPSTPRAACASPMPSTSRPRSS